MQGSNAAHRAAVSAVLLKQLQVVLHSGVGSLHPSMLALLAAVMHCLRQSTKYNGLQMGTHLRKTGTVPGPGLELQGQARSRVEAAAKTGRVKFGTFTHKVALQHGRCYSISGLLCQSHKSRLDAHCCRNTARCLSCQLVMSAAVASVQLQCGYSP